MPLQDSDNFIVGRGSDTYKITYQDLKDDLNYVPPPSGTIDKPTVLAPADGAGSGASRPIVTDAITAVQDDGANKKLVLAGSTDLDVLNVGDVVRSSGSYTPKTSSIDSVLSAFVVNETDSSANVGNTINISNLPDGSEFVILSIEDGKGGSSGGQGGRNEFPRGGCAGRGGDAGNTYYRKFTKEEYITEFGNTYTQSKSNNFNGIEIYGNSQATSAPPTDSRCAGGGGGSKGSLPAVANTIQDLNEALGGAVTVTLGSGGASGSYSGPSDNDRNYWGQSGQGGMGGLIIDSNVLTIPFVPTASPGSASSDDRGGGGGGGGQGFGAGGGGGGADGDNSTNNKVGSGGNGATGINIFLVGVRSTDITLNDNTDLAYFRVGDVVQGNYDISELGPSNWAAGDSDGSKVFDGDSNTLVANYNGTSGKAWNLTNPVEMPVKGQTVELLVHQYNKNDDFECQVRYDTGSVYVTAAMGVPFGSDPPAWITATVSADIGTKITGVFLYSYAGATHAIELYGMRVNGKVVDFNDGNISTGVGARIVDINANANTISVDGGEWSGTDGTGNSNGDAEVTCVSPLKEATDWTIEAIGSNTLTLSHATPDDNAQVWVANDNQAGTDFFVTGPNYVDEPLLTADVELESSNFATTPADSDTLNNIVWELNGVEQNVGTINPYKPTLNTSTTYTVRVKHEGNTINESPWSDQTTFTTGAVRNLYEYQRDQIQSLTTRVGGLEANDITDDATDTALLTLLSNLAIRVQALEESN